MTNQKSDLDSFLILDLQKGTAKVLKDFVRQDKKWKENKL